MLDKEFKDQLSFEFQQIAQEKGGELIAHSVLEDHVHMLIKQSLTDSTNYIIRMFKGVSSRRFFQEFKTNRFEYRKLWGRGYYAKIVEEKDLPRVIGYIKNQIGADGYDKRC